MRFPMLGPGPGVARRGDWVTDVIPLVFSSTHPLCGRQLFLCLESLICLTTKVGVDGGGSCPRVTEGSAVTTLHTPRTSIPQSAYSLHFPSAPRASFKIIQQGAGGEGRGREIVTKQDGPDADICGSQMRGTQGFMTAVSLLLCMFESSK